MPMNLKDEIVAGESYSIEFKLVPNEEREKYLKTVVAFGRFCKDRLRFVSNGQLRMVVRLSPHLHHFRLTAAEIN